MITNRLNFDCRERVGYTKLLLFAKYEFDDERQEKKKKSKSSKNLTWPCMVT